MKRFLSILLVFILMFSLVACGDSSGGTKEPETADKTETEGGETTNKDYKIGIMTGTVSQGEEEFRAAEKMKEVHGSMIQTVTYPDKFAQETETTIAQLQSLAADKDVKALVICQAVPGTSPAIDLIKEDRDDLLYIMGVPQEDPGVVIERGDLILEPDQVQRGINIMKKAEAMGAKTFIHYSFPRHMSMELLSARRDKLKETAAELGIEFVEIDAPDPTADAGTPATQQFILEDVPRQIEKYGKDTAFFGTNCGMQEQIIKQTLDNGGIYPEQCCPSPYHAYPQALGIKIPKDKAGDLDYLNAEISAKIEEKGGSGRFGTWKYPVNSTMIEAGTQYAMDYLDGVITEKLDVDHITKLIKEVTKDTDDEVIITPMSDEMPNFLLIVLGDLIY